MTCDFFLFMMVPRETLKWFSMTWKDFASPCGSFLKDFCQAWTLGFALKFWAPCIDWIHRNLYQTRIIDNLRKVGACIKYQAKLSSSVLLGSTKQVEREPCTLSVVESLWRLEAIRPGQISPELPFMWKKVSWLWFKGVAWRLLLLRWWGLPFSDSWWKSIVSVSVRMCRSVCICFAP